MLLVPRFWLSQHHGIDLNSCVKSLTTAGYMARCMAVSPPPIRCGSAHSERGFTKFISMIEQSVTWLRQKHDHDDNKETHGFISICTAERVRWNLRRQTPRVTSANRWEDMEEL